MPQENASFVDALVANSDIAKGTTGDEVLQAGLVEQGEGARKGSVPPSVDHQPERPRRQGRRRPRSTRSSSSPRRPSSRRRTASAVVRRRRSPSEDLVAVTVTVDADRGVANQIAPGDHVNIATRSTTDADGQRDRPSTSCRTSRCSRSARRRCSSRPAPADRRPTAARRRRRNSGVLTFEVSPGRRAAGDRRRTAAAARSTWCCCRPTRQRRPPGGAKAAASGK